VNDDAVLRIIWSWNLHCRDYVSRATLLHL
jgi:hypothetical protein